MRLALAMRSREHARQPASGAALVAKLELLAKLCEHGLCFHQQSLSISFIPDVLQICLQPCDYTLAPPLTQGCQHLCKDAPEIDDGFAVDCLAVQDIAIQRFACLGPQMFDHCGPDDHMQAVFIGHDARQFQALVVEPRQRNLDCLAACARIAGRIATTCMLDMIGGKSKGLVGPQMQQRSRPIIGHSHASCGHGKLQAFP
mmetsp:Transcript_121578/g.259530  ORF Transcript_121578/g.259530 Transcript_121578/m.259530 type:complete len:201 (-) Transcript_121578:38-640(-)|eukprot:CAMPEP_0180686168 /NCGR_PEP_ID=MMETSP1037_2-20121125/72795_1 /TAXON_ID=632150 /ORGANISM="Azadinium spinosum, Strain 3D9" /LENGTH=200 /DNA_ID=CAMNT_0022716907 /DNA_START=1958 /DNA_END=2560 /DNA_ORIENTATION=-